MLSKYTLRISAPFREFGIFAGSLYVVDKALRSISPQIRLFFYEMMVQPVPAQPVFRGRIANSIEVRRIEKSSPEIKLMPARSDIIERRFSQEAICLGGYKKNKLMGYIWLSTNSYEEDEARCTYVLTDKEHSVFDFDLYIFPEYRMGLTFIGLWNGTNRYLREQGIYYTFSRMTRYNTASRKSHSHLGCKVVANVFVLKFWSLEVLVTTKSPYFSITLSKNSRAKIPLSSNILPDK